MELITEYRFDGMNNKRVTAKLYYDADAMSVVKTYDDAHPESKSALMLRETLSAKPYDRLFSANRVLLDFLNARLGD